MTLTQSPQDTVLVGVDDGRACLDAAAWAAEEARLRGARLKLVHVPRAGQTTRGVEEVFVQAVRIVLSAAPDVELETVALCGDVARALIDESRTADLLVLGVDVTRSRASHQMMGSVEDRVAAQSGCPVVWVPHLPRPVTAPVVLALVDPADLALRIVRSAAQEADLRASALRVLLPPNLQQAGQRQRLEHTFLEIERDHPGLPVTAATAPGSVRAVLKLVHGPGLGGLELVVMRGTHSTDPWALRTSALGTELARRGPFPVMYVPDRDHGSPELPLAEQAQEIQAARALALAL